MLQPTIPSDNNRSSGRHTIAQRLASALKRHGVEVLFGQSLPSALILACEDLGIRQLVYRTENAGGAMADGYARASHKIGVVTAQNGPAATLLVPPLAEALKASIPILALVQEVNRGHEDRNAFQSLDQIKLFESCTKWVRCLRDGHRAEDYLDMAIAAATSGRPGPAALLLPADLLNEIAEPAPLPRTATLGHWPLDRPVADPERVDSAARLIAAAENPLIIAGGGVHGSQAWDSLARLQETACLPVATTTMGKGCVDECHPLSVGLVGNTMGEKSLGRYTRPLVDNADLILLIGNRSNQNGTDSWTLLPPSARLIHLDIDSAEVGRNYESLRLVGDARTTLESLTRALLQQNLDRRRAARTPVEQQIAAAKTQHRQATLALSRSDATPIRPERIMNEIEAVMTDRTCLVADASYSSVWITAYLQARTPGQRFLTPRGLAGLGWGFPMAIGAKAARPDDQVICVVGDGGFGHCWSELETAKRTGIPLVLIVINNSVLGFQKDAETVKFGRYTSACHFATVDHTAIARACGIQAHRIDHPDQLATQLKKAIDSGEMTLLDVIADPDAYPPITLFDGKL